ncbi:hypothetical protein P171DRAFT_436282 [Karstenula rhodostoma CBS 690.94]|uniref:Uncharacterized protein n=1 Tax=Karstenula rhodostoma CBS 690.94 TaxID=1392251 RepID=A0A9P4P985_9PLEO|nr:hypothetical protein P171DRAFT_436282 [Karstenula rhodostoma CBS 690.94]
MSNPRPRPFPTRARRAQWEVGIWDLAEWNALVANYPADSREQLRKLEEQDERERQEEFGIPDAERRRKWYRLGGG